MNYSEIDVQEVLEGFPPPPGMTPGSKREVVRRLDERAAQRGEPVKTIGWLAELLNVDPRTVTRYRSRIRQEAIAARVAADQHQTLAWDGVEDTEAAAEADRHITSAAAEELA